MDLRYMLAAALAVATATGAAAQDQQPLPLAQQLYDCRAVADPGERLACYDRQVAALQSAEANREIRVIDREQVREARRGLFGLSLGNFNLFGRGSDEADPAEAVDEIEALVAGIGRDPQDRLLLTLDNGQRWVQTETGQRRVRTGETIRIRRAALGSFMANVEGRPAFRVRRDR